MPDVPETVTETSVSPTDAFSVLANGDRLDILLALGDANERTAVHSLSFEELRRRSGVSDSGRFNYHLQQLRDVFVTKDGDEYDLLYPGVVLYRAVRADLFTARPRIEKFDVGADCLQCGTGLHGHYRNQIMVLDCPDCGHLALKYYVPPAVLRDGSVDDILAAGDTYSRRDVMTVAAHVCPTCGNRITHEVLPEAEESSELAADIDEVAVVHYCFHCDHFLTTSVSALLLYEPAVVAFLFEHGLDALGTPLWELDLGSLSTVEIRDGDPAALIARFSVGGDTLTVELDDDLTVTATESPADSSELSDQG